MTRAQTAITLAILSIVFSASVSHGSLLSFGISLAACLAISASILVSLE